MRAFPVDGASTFADEFDSDHRGIDIFAAAGAPVVAVDDGAVRSGQELRGGNVVYLAAAGVTYFYAHLQTHVGIFPRSVRAGDVIGTVGETGNARGTGAHVHFEMHRAGETINPYESLARARRGGNSNGVRLVAGVLLLFGAAKLLAGRFG